MIITKKSLAAAAVAATALAGLGVTTVSPADAAATANKTVTKSFTQTCQTVGILGQNSFPSKITVTLPTAVKKGSTFNVATKISITIPASVNQKAYAAGAREQKTTFNTINVNTTKLGVSPKDITGAGNAGAPRLGIPPSSPTTLNLPPLATGFKATAVGTATAKTGLIKGNFQLYNAAGSPLGGPQPLECAAQNVLITTLNVTS